MIIQNYQLNIEHNDMTLGLVVDFMDEEVSLTIDFSYLRKSSIHPYAETNICSASQESVLNRYGIYFDKGLSKHPSKEFFKDLYKALLLDLEFMEEPKDYNEETGEPQYVGAEHARMFKRFLKTCPEFAEARGEF